MAYERLLKHLEYDKDRYTTKYSAKNPWREDGEHVYILINNGREAMVDKYDFFDLRLYSYHWHSSSTNPAFDYPITNLPDYSGKLMRLGLHQLIAGKKPGLVIDHMDGDHYELRNHFRTFSSGDSMVSPESKFAVNTRSVCIIAEDYRYSCSSCSIKKLCCCRYNCLCAVTCECAGHEVVKHVNDKDCWFF